MTLDPGTVTGFANFDGKKLSAWGTIRGKGKNFVEKAEYITRCMRPSQSDTLFIEWPSFQSQIGVDTQSINKLCFLIGRLWKPEVELLPVSKWRGNCPKEVLWRRAETFFKIKKGILKNHEGDCIAMGQWLIENGMV